jgi:hypothetical protein
MERKDMVKKSFNMGREKTGCTNEWNWKEIRSKGGKEIKIRNG